MKLSKSHNHYILYKPYHVLSQFTIEVAGQKCLKDIIDVPSDVYAVGRLDYDSEGLLLLSNDKALNKALLDPQNHVAKTYYVQVEGLVDALTRDKLRSGIEISLPNKTKYLTQRCEAKIIPEPLLPERNPPIRFRKDKPTTWMSITISEGKNRQVRKMLAACGFPVLRLVRYSFGPYTIDGMASGELKFIQE